MLTVLNAQKAYQVKRQMMGGEEYLVVPITLINEGVHCGNQGCFLYDKKIIAESVKAWAGKPITVNHPADGLGQPCLCNTPNIFDSYVIGQVFNPRLENASLKADGWLSLKRMASINNNLLDKLLKGDMINVSTGLTANGLNDKGGVWNNEQYIGEVLGIMPDHLAILPNDDGACSLQDGCGIRNQAAPKKEKENMAWNEKIFSVLKRQIGIMAEIVKDENDAISPVIDDAKPIANGDAKPAEIITAKAEEKIIMAECDKKTETVVNVTAGDAKPLSIDNVVANAGEHAGRIKAGLALLDEKRKGTIDAIMNTKGNTFKRETLEAMPCEMLTNIAAIADSKKADEKPVENAKPAYIGNAGAGVSAGAGASEDDKPLGILNLADYFKPRDVNANNKGRE